jgi:hypothetical protein
MVGMVDMVDMAAIDDPTMGDTEEDMVDTVDMEAIEDPTTAEAYP